MSIGEDTIARPLANPRSQRDTLPINLSSIPISRRMRCLFPTIRFSDHHRKIMFSLVLFLESGIGQLSAIALLIQGEIDKPHDILP